MRVDGSVIHILVVSEDIFHDSFAFDDDSLVIDEILQKREFRLCDFDILPAHLEGEVGHIKRKVSVFRESAWFCGWVDSLEHGLDSRKKFTRREWLADIIISSEFESTNLIFFATASRKDNYRCVGYLSDFFTYLEPAFSRKIQVENHELWLTLREHIHRFRSILTFTERKTTLF